VSTGHQSLDQQLDALAKAGVDFEPHLQRQALGAALRPANTCTVLHCLPPKDWTEPGFMGLGMIYTAMPVTNAVPAVVAAKPGS